MADIQKLYEQWLAKATADPDLKAELESIKNDEDGKNDRFYRDLEFGTGGVPDRAARLHAVFLRVPAGYYFQL